METIFTSSLLANSWRFIKEKKTTTLTKKKKKKAFHYKLHQDCYCWLFEYNDSSQWQLFRSLLHNAAHLDTLEAHRCITELPAPINCRPTSRKSRGLPRQFSQQIRAGYMSSTSGHWHASFWLFFTSYTNDDRPHWEAALQPEWIA